MSAPAPAAAASRPRFSNAYELFILVLTILSLVIMVGQVVRRANDATATLLNAYENIICLVFIGDFIARLWRAPSKRGYFIRERGWLDLLGSIPSFGFLGGSGKWTTLFRLARISRLIRNVRFFRKEGKDKILDNILKNRSQYAVFITLTAAMLVLVFASIFVLQFEATAPDGNIKTGGEAIWWAIVTMTTVGYGDYFPVTAPGRITGVFVMFTGIGIIGALASIFASLLVSSDGSQDDASALTSSELSALRDDIAALRRELAARGGPP